MSRVTLQEITDWLDDKVDKQDISKNAIDEWHMRHPRYQFLSKAENQTLLDIGCGDGGLGIYLKWPQPLKTTRIVGCDLAESSVPPSGYSDYIGGGFEQLQNLTPYKSISAIHLIEHLPDLTALIEVLERAEPNTRLYIEWPSMESVNFPRAAEIAKVHLYGHLIMTSNFQDDSSHIGDKPPVREEVINLLERSGWVVSFAHLLQHDENREFKSAMLHNGDSGGVTLAFWETFGFAQYLLALKK